MLAGSENKTENGLKGLLPFITTLFFILLTQLQYKMYFLENIFPFLSLAAVYYWGIFKPRLMPVSAVFFLGLLQDILSGGPLGLMALLLMIVRLFVLRQGSRFLEREFLFNWLVFILASFVFGAALWAISSIYLKETQVIWNMLGQSLLTIAIFPLVVWFLGWVRHFLVTENR